jgi:hypothetical protein
MGKFRLALITLLIALVFATLADAAMVDPVRLWVYDEPGSAGDGMASLTLSNFDFSGSSVPATVQYSIDNGTNWLNAVSVINLSGEQHQVFFRLSPDQGPVITTGDLIFQGQDGGYYNGATINWAGYTDMTIAIAGNKDKLSPMNTSVSTVPIPPSALLFGSGFIGMFFKRRKKTVS